VKKTMLLAICIGLTLPLAGCWNSKDIQNMAYVTALGIDFKDGKFISYVQVLNFTNVAKTEMSELGKNVPIWIGKGEGRTVTESFNSIYATSQIRVFWGHVKAVICTENFLKKPDRMKEAYDLLNRYREVRYNVLMYGTKEPLQTIFVQKSLLNFSPLDTIMYSPKQMFSQRSFILPIYGFKIMAQINEPGTGAILPTLSIDKGSWREDQKEKGVLKINGAYLFHNQKLRGWLSEHDLKGYRWMQHQLERSPINIYRENKHPSAAIVMLHPKSRITPYFEDGKAYFNLSIRIEAYLDELTETLSEAELEQKAAKLVQDEIRYTFLKGIQIGSDVLKLEEALYRKYPKQWRAVQKDNETMITKDSLKKIEVKVSLLHAGKYKGRAD